MKIQFEFNDRDAKAISFLTALLTAMKAEQQPEQVNEEQASGNQEQESARQDSGGEESVGQRAGETQSLIENGMDPDHCKQAVEKNIAELEDLIITATAKVMELTEQKYACFSGH